MEKVSSSHEDYLEAIVMLGGTPDNPIRSVDIAKKLGVSKTAVSKTITSLKEKGMLVQPFYGDVTLTDAGFEYGNSVYKRHRSLVVFLSEKIGLSPELAEEEACKMEHSISDESFELWLQYFKQIGIEVE